TVAVKKGIGQASARMLVPSRARELIEDGAKHALSDLKAVQPYDPGKPCEVKVEYKHTTAARQMRFQHGVEFLDDRTIVSRVDDVNRHGDPMSMLRQPSPHADTDCPTGCSPGRVTERAARG